MFPLDSAAARSVQSWLGEPQGPGLLDLHHALAYHRPGLLGDDPRMPTSVLLVRDTEGQLEAFGAGAPAPALEWLAKRTGQRGALLAPTDWWLPAHRRLGGVERIEILTLSVDPFRFDPVSSNINVRRLTPADASAFLASEARPPWALFGWRTFQDLIDHGAAFVVPHGDGFAALAWVYTQAGCYDTIGVSTLPQFQRLGLGRAVASALVTEIVQRRGKVPVWTCARENLASHALAGSLGFSVVATETFLRWRL